MTTTTNLSLTLVEQSQSQKEVTVNEALIKIDAVLNRGAKDKDLATPPGSPATGDVYIVAASATGAWSGHSGRLAFYQQTWQFITPNEGMTIWVNDENKLYSYDGSAWVISASGGGGGGAAALDDLTDVTLTAQANNDFLVYNGSAWVNKTPLQSRTSMGVVIGTDVQAYDADLTALAGLSSNGMVARTGAGTAAARTITGTTNLVTVTNGDGVSGNPTLTVGSLVARTDTVQHFTKQQYFGEATLTDGANIAWNLENAQTAKITLGGNRTLDNPTNMQAGATYMLRVIQDGTGSRTLSYGTAYKWPAGAAPTLTTAANAVDVISFYCNGTQMLGVAQKDFK